jgi:hypothetical protein
VGQTPVQCTPGRHCARRARDLGACIAGECNPPGRAEGVKAVEPKWIVNDMGELGVMVEGRAYFLYKGDNIEYETEADEWIEAEDDSDGVTPTVPVGRPATMEEAQHAAQIGACLPNGVLFDAFGRERKRYVRVTLDGSHLILHPNELAAFKANEEEPERFTYTDVYLSPEEADALPEFDGF